MLGSPCVEDQEEQVRARLWSGASPLPKKHTAAEYRKVMSTKLSFSCYSTFQCSPIHVPWPGGECWGIFQQRYLHPEENPSLEGLFFFSVLFCFVFAQSKCCTGVSPGSHRFQLIPDHRWRPHFLGTSFPRELSLCCTHFCVLAHATPSLAPSQSQGIVSPLSPIDFFFPPHGKFPVYKMTKEMFN